MRRQGGPLPSMDDEVMMDFGEVLKGRGGRCPCRRHSAPTFNQNAARRTPCQKHLPTRAKAAK